MQSEGLFRTQVDFGWKLRASDLWSGEVSRVRDVCRTSKPSGKVKQVFYDSAVVEGNKNPVVT